MNNFEVLAALCSHESICTHCLQYKRLRAGETSAMNNFLKNESWHCLEEAEDDLESHK